MVKEFISSASVADYRRPRGEECMSQKRLEVILTRLLAATLREVEP